MLVPKKYQVPLLLLSALFASVLAVVNQKSDNKVTHRRDIPSQTDENGYLISNNLDHPTHNSDDIDARISNFEATTPVFPLTAPPDDYGQAGLSPPDRQPVLENKDSGPGYSYEALLKSTYGPPNHQLSYSPPQQIYGLPPTPSYGSSPRPYYPPPRPSYGPPLPPPKPIYGLPLQPLKPMYGPPPKPSYGPPNFFKPNHGPPKPNYGAPNLSQLKPQYRPPRPDYGPANTEYGPLPPPHVSEYNPLKPTHGPLGPEYGLPPKPEHGPPSLEYGLLPHTPTQYKPPKPIYKPSQSYLPPDSGPKFENIFLNKFLFPIKSNGPFGSDFQSSGISAPPTTPVVSYDGWRPMKVPEFKDLQFVQQAGPLIESHKDQVVPCCGVSSTTYEGLSPPLPPQSIALNYNLAKPLSDFGNSIQPYNNGPTGIGSYGVPSVAVQNCDHANGQFSSSGCCGATADITSFNELTKYGVPYGVQSGKTVDAPNLQPKTPVKFRPPVPSGLLESKFGSSQASTFMGQSYIPPAVPELTKTSHETPSTDYTKDSLPFDVPPTPSHLLEIPHQLNTFQHSTPTPNIQFGAPQSSYSVLTVPEYSSPSHEYNSPTSPSSAIIDHTESVPTFIDYVKTSSGTSGAHAEQSFNIPNGLASVPSSYQQNYQSAPEFQTLFNGLKVSDRAIPPSQSIELPASGPVQEYPVQGNHGQYTLQIPSQDGGVNGLPAIRHDQLLSNGLLQDILAAIEQQTSAGHGGQSAGFYEKNENIWPADTSNGYYGANSDFNEDRSQRHLVNSERNNNGDKNSKERENHPTNTFNEEYKDNFEFRLFESSKNVSNDKYVIIGQEERDNNNGHNFDVPTASIVNSTTMSPLT